jgi:PAS domain-containing protein
MSSAIKDTFHRVVLDAMPSPVLVVDEEVRIVDVNANAAKMLASNPDLIIRRSAGEVLHCVHSGDVPGGCGKGPLCGHCTVRNSVNEAFKGQKQVRQRARMTLTLDCKNVESFFLVTTVPFDYKNKRLVLVILEEMNELMALKSLLPICINCKKVRNDQAYWQSVESYLETYLAVDFSHGICPKCANELYPDVFHE